MTNKSRRKNKAVANNSARSGRISNFRSGLVPGYSAGDTKRNVWANVGYPEHITFDMLWSISSRGIGKAGIDRIVNKCWQDNPVITDGENDGERPLTPFEQDVKVLIDKHKMFAMMKGADRYNRIGQYSGIIPIVKDGGQPETEISRLSSIKSVVKLFPVKQSQIDVDGVGYNSDLDSVNFGMPSYFNYRADQDRNPITNSNFELHPSRVFVFAEGSCDGSIFGIPANEAGFNALLDMEKVAGASCEGQYKNAKQRSVINVTDGATAGVLTTDKAKRAAFDDNVKAFERDMDGMLTVYGMDVKTLQSTMADPTHPWTISLNTYCATIECPATILIGQQTGRLASDEDQKDWALTAQSRCNNVITPMLITPFLQYMVDIGAVRPPVNEIVVAWPNFTEAAPSDKLASGKVMAEVNKLARESGSSQPVFTDEEIRETSGFDKVPEDDLELFGEDDELPVRGLDEDKA